MVSNPLMTMQFVMDENGRIIAIEQYYLNHLSNRAEKVFD
jgi:hypothetical protein